MHATERVNSHHSQCLQRLSTARQRRCNATYYGKANADIRSVLCFAIVWATLLNLCCAVVHLDGHHQHQHRLVHAVPGPAAAAAHAHVPQRTPLQVVKQWKLFTFDFLPHAPTQDMNFFNPMNVLATGLAVTDDRIFIATPKLFSGVPSTLNWISKSEFEGSPVLKAYPDWSFSTTGRTDFNCSDLVLVSVYRMRLDSCNRLWVLDAGISRSLEDYEKTCPPKILVFDMNTNQVVRRIDFPAGVLRGESLFTNLVIDETTASAGTCDDVFVYISDTVEPGIVVYDSVRDTTWRVSHPAMYPDPDFAQAEILNDRFVLMDGIVGFTFDPLKALVYFQPFATDRIFSITRDVLRAGPISINQVLPVKLVGKKSSQGIGITVSPIDGSLIFSPVTETAVASWNPNTNEQSILAKDQDNLQFVADMTVSSYEQGYVYVVSSKFHRFFLKNLNEQEVNNRIIKIPLPGGVKPPAAPHSYLPPSFPHKSFSELSLPLSSYYQFSNSIQPKAISNPTTAQGYFSQPTAKVAKHPYAFENSGIINYSMKNPFTALNQGEAFPPRKELRNQDQYSFLESLAAISSSDPHTSPIALPTNPHGFYYRRPARNVKSTKTE